MRFPHSILVLALSGSAIIASAQTYNPKPVKELGAPRLIATAANPLAVDTLNPNYIEGKELFNPAAVALDNSTSPPAVYVADTSNNRVLGWKYASQLANGAPADIVLGQNDFFSTLPQGPGNGAATGVHLPSGLAVDKAGNVYVADSANNRILRFPKPFAQPPGPAFPDLVLGQSGFNTGTANPGGIQANTLNLDPGGGFPPHIGMTFDSSGNLFIADYGNHRVLRYPASVLTAGTNGANADTVIGQQSFTANTSQGDRINKTGLNLPQGVAIDGSGRLFVSDSLARVLVYVPPFPATTAVATRIMGIPTQIAGQPPTGPVTDSGFGLVTSVTMASGHPVLVDVSDNRVLVFDTYDNWPAETKAFSPSATAVVGQNTFTLRAANQGLPAPTAFTLSTPLDAAASANELWVADTNNNRVLVFPLPNATPGLNATRVIGQLNMSLNSPNLLEGKEFFLNSNGLTGSIVIDRNSSPPHLYVADTGNNRVLGFFDFLHAQAGATADLVIGQPSLFQAQINVPTNDPTKPAQNTLFAPTALALDAAGNLFVADTGNARVLRFPQPFAQNAPRAMPNADMVIGQTDFVSRVTDPTNRTMRAPEGIAITSDGSLLVSDAALNRVTFYNKPLTTGMFANKVIGQSDFTSPNSNTGTIPPGSSPSRLNGPRQIAVDPQDRVYICDTGSGRIAIFDSIGNLASTLPAPAFSLTSNLSQPASVIVGPAGTPYAGQIWVADFNQNLALHYPAFTTLLQNSTPDNAVPAVHPLAAAFDSFGDIVIADSASRVVLFAPQLSITNAANFQTGPVAPGTIVSVFPAAAAGGITASLSTGTASYTDLPNPVPLPTSLGNAQVLVNNQPAPLFYVSPGQINMPLPSNLPTSGTVPMVITDKTSGRIYGLTDITMSAVSPALFTVGSTGTGAAAAINEDGTINSPSNTLLRGHAITFFGTGEGIVPNAPPDGTPATGPTPTVDQPLVVIGGVQLDPGNVLYSGLAPTLVGVWQVNVLVPQTVTAGNAIQVDMFLESVPTVKTTISLR